MWIILSMGKCLVFEHGPQSQLRCLSRTRTTVPVFDNGLETLTKVKGTHVKV